MKEAPFVVPSLECSQHILPFSGFSMVLRGRPGHLGDSSPAHLGCRCQVVLSLTTGPCV